MVQSTNTSSGARDESSNSSSVSTLVCAEGKDDVQRGSDSVAQPTRLLARSEGQSWQMLPRSRSQNGLRARSAWTQSHRRSDPSFRCEPRTERLHVVADARCEDKCMDNENHRGAEARRHNQAHMDSSVLQSRIHLGTIHGHMQGRGSAALSCRDQYGRGAGLHRQLRGNSPIPHLLARQAWWHANSIQNWRMRSGQHF